MHLDQGKIQTIKLFKWWSRCERVGDHQPKGVFQVQSDRKDYMWTNKEKNVTQENTKILNISYLQCKLWKKNKSIWILEMFYMERKWLLKEVTQFICDKKPKFFISEKILNRREPWYHGVTYGIYKSKTFLHSIWSKGATL